MTLADCYKLLELSDGSSHKEVRAARRTLLMQWHPDKVAHNPALQEIALEQSKKINIAADFLLAQQPFVSPPPSDQQQTNSNASNHSQATEEDRRQSERDQRHADEEAERRQRETEQRQQQEADKEARQRQEESQRQHAEETKQQRQDAEDQQWQEQQWQRDPIDFEEDWQARRKEQQKPEAAQKAEQTRQREVAKKARAIRSRLWWAAFSVIAVINWYATHPAHQAPGAIPQQVYKTPQVTAPLEDTPTNPVQQTGDIPKWLATRNDWIKSDDGRSILGYSPSQVHQLLGMPTAIVNRSATSQDDLWFPGTAAQPDSDPKNPAFEGFVSVIYKNGRVIQIENDVLSTPKLRPEYSTLRAIMNIHPRLQTATISYSDLLTADNMAIKLSQRDFDVANISRDEAMHFLGKTRVMYYDDVNNGIAFLVEVAYIGHIDSDYGVTADTQPDRIIVHTPGMNVIPAGYGDREQEKNSPR